MIPQIIFRSSSSILFSGLRSISSRFSSNFADFESQSSSSSSPTSSDPFGSFQNQEQHQDPFQSQDHQDHGNVQENESSDKPPPATFSSVNLTGYAGSPPKVINTGKFEFCSVPIATHTLTKSGDKFKSVTHWHTVLIFDKLLSNYMQKYCKKGSLVTVSNGSLEYRTSNGPQGQQVKSTAIMCRRNSIVAVLKSPESSDM